jgi:hypothetical protein
MITSEQQELIAAMRDALGWDARYLAGVSRRICGRDWPQTRRDGRKLVEAMKAQILRKLDGRVDLDGELSREDLSDWERDFLLDLKGRAERGEVKLNAGQLCKLAEITHLAATGRT